MPRCRGAGREAWLSRINWHKRGKDSDWGGAAEEWAPGAGGLRIAAAGGAGGARGGEDPLKGWGQTSLKCRPREEGETKGVKESVAADTSARVLTQCSTNREGGYQPATR